jgi:GTP cyclohydrolase I
MDRQRAILAAEELLRALGHELSVESRARTPERLVDYLSEFSDDKPVPRLTTFPADASRGMIVQTGIPVESLCEHHIALFEGKATVGYLPGSRILGLSKLARVVEYWSRRLQTQERLTIQIAEFLQDVLEAPGVGVIIEARHSCMSVRGVRVHGVNTITTELTGFFLKDASVRSEFLAYHHHSKA